MREINLLQALLTGAGGSMCRIDCRARRGTPSGTTFSPGNSAASFSGGSGNARKATEFRVVLVREAGAGKPPFTLHPTPSPLNPTPYTLHPTPYTLPP